MFIDARALPASSRFEADLAIIGGGAAGIAIARAFVGTRTLVCLVESGGLERDPEVQALYEGEITGLDYPLSGSRVRCFGGTTTHWGGFCRPLDAIDFEPRDWVPHSGWPFGREELDPYYPGAAALVEVGEPRFEDPDYWREQTGEGLLAWRTGRVYDRFFQFSPPTRFGSRYRDDLGKADNVRVLLHANVTNIAAAEGGGAVDHLAVRTLTGQGHEVRARSYVLAAGGLENARILLYSNDVQPAGLGNGNDLVGRFFMEHPHIGGMAEIVVAELPRLPRIYRDSVAVEGRTARVAFVPRPDFLREARLLNASFTVGVAGSYPAAGKPPDGPPTAAAHAAMLRAAGPFLAQERNPDRRETLGHWLGVGCACEQVPNPDSRVLLLRDKDALGLPRLHLDWRLTEQDRRSFYQHVRSLGLELAAQGVGRMLVKVEDDGIWPRHVGGGSHHMGTTRMHDDPKRGVVDANCRVHGIDNLYLAGSSVFPTSGSANPTINLLALALRLVEQLKGRLS